LRALREVAGRAVGERAIRVARPHLLGDQEHPARERAPRDQRQQPLAVQPRHRRVEHDHVRLEVDHGGERRAGVVRLGDEPHVGVLAYDARDAVAVQRMGVDGDDANDAQVPSIFKGHDCTFAPSPQGLLSTISSSVCGLDYRCSMRVVASERAGASSPLRELASTASALLSEYPQVVGVCLIGSVARGNERPSSDVDLLVLCARPTNARQLREFLADRRLATDRLSLLPYTEASWNRQVGRGDLFVAHVVSEGIPLHDIEGRLARALDGASRRPRDVLVEKTRQLARLAPYRDIRRLNGNCLFALARIYSVGKAVAIARTVELGSPRFVKEEAFETLAQQRPKLRPAVTRVAELRPFYDLTLERFPQALPFDYHGAETVVEAGIVAVGELADG
jgi:predicted nucleotidyltransferase